MTTTPPQDKAPWPPRVWKNNKRDAICLGDVEIFSASTEEMGSGQTPYISLMEHEHLMQDRVNGLREHYQKYCEQQVRERESEAWVEAAALIIKLGINGMHPSKMASVFMDIAQEKAQAMRVLSRENHKEKE